MSWTAALCGTTIPIGLPGSSASSATTGGEAFPGMEPASASAGCDDEKCDGSSPPPDGFEIFRRTLTFDGLRVSCSLSPDPAGIEPSLDPGETDCSCCAVSVDWGCPSLWGSPSRRCESSVASGNSCSTCPSAEPCDALFRLRIVAIGLSTCCAGCFVYWCPPSHATSVGVGGLSMVIVLCRVQASGS